MTTEPIRNDEDLQRAFRRPESVFQAEEGSAQARERDVLVTLIEDYESERQGFGPVGPKRP
jgi:HTH-type transcriptional regulator/antitoxin HigA